ncbi:MAG: ABC transporter permease [Deltaproteobacteria bacterium]|nr:ABC transporter permease [Deltaproteobacteria bacterium]
MMREEANMAKPILTGTEDVTFIPKGESLLRQGLRRFRKNRMALASFVFLVLLTLVAVFAPLIAPAHYSTDDLGATYEKPGANYPLGADFMGRDVLSRIIYGSRVSLAVAFIGALVSFLMGLGYGVTAGYLGGRWDEWMMRAVDVLYALPSLVIIILIMVYFRAGDPASFKGFKALLYEWDRAMGGMLFIFIGLGLTSWLQMARISRAEALSIRRREFMENTQAQGLSHRRVILRHMLPNILGPCIVVESAHIPLYILTEAFLSFIGLGVNPPMPSWGSMINEGYQAMRSYPHVILWPVVLLTVTVLAFNYVGDGLRDALDPRLND